MTLTFAVALIVAALIVSCGAFTAAWRRDAAALAALPMFAAGAAVCAAGVSRFAAGPADAQTGEELAALVAVVGLAGAILGRALIGRRIER